MFESTSIPAPICERCGHDDTYHTTTRCVRTEGGYGKTQEQRGVCDCPGWKRDLLWPTAAPEDRAEGLDVERLSEVDSIVSTLHDFRELLPDDRRAVFDKFAWRAHDILRPALAARLTPDRTPTEEERP